MKFFAPTALEWPSLARFLVSKNLIKAQLLRTARKGTFVLKQLGNLAEEQALNPWVRKGPSASRTGLASLLNGIVAAATKHVPLATLVHGWVQLLM
eukprot:CAMPEP_0177359754 /NCGR_PEP_ID=MMETSP0368-20130122/36287_1 /TAXON_ID=447022 ORGANISM="Scrippsiella hangoei-like, Strain SHHI-4" /NCGR_SAMPLE_ID=MMETSP0368 /ASSEMBLY_ACC=CAM_ASM_000363 /LENGTH=95 /DNA_ID=CAMNT_0018822293 /DNA_START=465 /DNA_END=749 /DNA_ORIENTATION=-